MSIYKFSYGKTSLKRLLTCHSDLQHLCFELIKHRDIIIICGHRKKAEQNKAFRLHHSLIPWPDSLHNKNPSLAIDMALYHKTKPHIHWEDSQEFLEFSGFVKGVAATLSIAIKWGGDWKLFRDFPHWQLKV